MNTYAVKSSAHRAAKQAGLTKEEYVIVEIDGKFGFERIGAAEPVVDTPVADTPVVGEFTDCPHCGEHLSNGYSEHGQDVNGKAYQHKAFAYQCLCCGGEFGPEIAKEEPATPAKVKTPRVINHVSTVELPTKLVWHIADEMLAANPDVRRKEVIEECVRCGIAYYTARTQYQQWQAVAKGSTK